ncbi:MAG: hypothetical protein HPY45_08300 [Anaerolineae bacterium]|nr:hypothetical protein [Anaerolineae bacterium]
MPEEQGNQNESNSHESQNETFETWLDKQDEKVKALYSAHITGLKNTVSATRQERDELAKQIRELAGKAEKGSEAEKALKDISARLEAAERRAAFLEEASKPEIGCRNPKAAYAVAIAEGLFNSKTGLPDWETLKKIAPEFFGVKPAGSGNAGDGAGGNAEGKFDMNAAIRRAAGR